MNRERLKYRKFLREMSWLVGAVGCVLVLFDWLLWPMIWPDGPWWVRVAGDAIGVGFLWAATRIAAHAVSQGRRARAGRDVG